MDGQPASVHFGVKYPIPQTLYTGFAQSASASNSASLYNPLPQIEQEDLGLALKMTPHVNGEGDVAIDVEAEFKSLGTIVFNTVPSIDQRKFAGNVILREGEWAVLAGLDQNSINRSRNGLAGLSDIPGVNQLLSENTRDKASSQTLILIKPHVTRLPISATISPQYLVGPVRGFKVLL
jgi:general secretion pathway protein D